MLWSAIRLACDQGFRLFDFGRTELGNEGLREFKRGWGTSEQELFYSSIGAPATDSQSSVKVERLLGTLIRHSPPWVARAIGASLYKYAA